MPNKIPILWLFVKAMIERGRVGCANRGAQHSLTVSVDAVKGEEGYEEGIRCGLK
jgi:hypothetical protein